MESRVWIILDAQIPMLEHYQASLYAALAPACSHTDELLRNI